jgi:hypothetical protein
VRPLAERFELNIAGTGIELISDFPWIPEPAVEKFYVPFRARGPADLSLTVRCGRLPRISPGEVLFDATDNRWRLSRSDGHCVLEIFANLPPHPRVQVAMVEPEWRTAEVQLLPIASVSRRPAWSLPRLMRPLGELLLINRLSHGRGGLFHGLGVIDRGKGLLFVGRSGAGKSTLAKLYEQAAPDAIILNDEHIAVTKRGRRFWVSGTPWPGAHSAFSAEAAPIHSVYVLEHAEANRRFPERASTLCALLLQQMFLPFWSREALAFALRFADELVRAVPAFRFGFVNDSGVIEFLREET